MMLSLCSNVAKRLPLWDVIKFDKFSPFVYANCQVYKLSAFEYMFQYIITDELRSESEKTVEQ